MASRKRVKPNRGGGGGVLATVSNSTVVKKGKQVANDSVYVATRLMKSTGKAAWIAATTFLVLGLPLLIAMDREQQLNELDLQHQSLLGTPTTTIAQPR
ncbi:primary active transporter [Lithospermum erythrorhizon]|uniref:Primary active transporter n=1 Tax=Lithospermum erythrorhizon TaxID=34254 RepID=A0AAV3PQL7_LITER